MHSALQLQNGPSSVASSSPPTPRAADAEAASPPPAVCKDTAGAVAAAAVISVEEAAAAVRAVVHSDAAPDQAIIVHPGGKQKMPRTNKRAKNVRKKKGLLLDSLIAMQGAPQEKQGELDAAPTSEVTAQQDASLTSTPAASPSAPVVENQVADEAKSASPELEIKSEETINDPLAASDDSTCHNCWATFPSLNELVVHLKKQHVQTHRICRPCQLFTFLNDLDFEKHHQKHVFDRRLSIRLEVLDPNSLPPLPTPCRAVARKRTAPPAAEAAPPQREPIKLTLRLTTGRQAKAAEERHEAARRAEMLTAAEKTSSSSPTTKEEALFEKAITELYNNVDTSGKGSPAQRSPTPSFVLRYSPSPPASTTSTDQQSESGTNSRPPSVGVMPTATIAVRSTESLQENPGAIIDTDALLRNMLDKITSPQPNVQEPEFVSLERLADTVGNLIGSPPISTTSATTTDPTAAAVVTSQAVPLRNLAAMQPSTMLPNLLINAHAANPMTANQVATTYGQQVPTTYAGPHYPQAMQSYVCDVCNTRWPNMIALDAHRAASGHFRCLTCNLVFPSNQALAGHSQSTHGHMPPQNSYPQSNVRNPPPLYRGPVPNMPQNYNQAMPPPLVYQQQQYRPGMPQRPMAPRLDQFRAAPPRAPPPGYNVPQRQPGPQQPVLRNVLQQPPVNQQQQQMGTPTKRPAPPNGASPPIKAKRPEIPARQPEDCQIIAVQRSGDGVPQIQSVQGSTSIPTTSPAEKPANTIVQLTNEITLSVKPSAADATKKVAQKAGANVASLLANRGITVTTSAKSKSNESAARNTPPAQNPAIPESLSMNSSISILPASRSNNSSANSQSSPAAGNFAVPRARPSPTQPASNPERPPRPPTVDLTSETQSNSSPHMRRSPLTCSVCQRPMPTSMALQQHMQVHHPQHAQQQQQASAAQQQAQQNKLPYRCPHCPASYPTVQGLQAHRQSVHKEVFPPPASPSDMGIPVVDLRAAGTVERLSRLGIHHYIPLPAQNSNGFFSIPIISAEMSRNPAIFSLQAMNATSVMPFGPLRALPR